MNVLAAIVESERANAALAWSIVAAIVVTAIVSARAGTYVWAALATTTAVLALVPTLRRWDPLVMLPWEVLALAAAPLVVGLVASVPIAGFLTVATIALLIAVELDAYTSVEMTSRFAVSFVVLVTMAVAGCWVVLQWTSDALLGTAHLTGVVDVMWDIVYATAFGGLAGVLFVLYFFKRDDAGYGDLTQEQDGEGNRDERGDHRSSSEPETTDSDTVLGLPKRQCWQGVRLLQGGLALLVGYAVVTVDPALFVNAALPLALTFAPALVRRTSGHEMGAGLALWIAAAAFLHTVGAIGLYTAFGWFDQFTHTLSATLVAGLGYAVVDALERTESDVDFPTEFRFVFLVIFVLAFGVAWEILEFAAGGLASLVGGDAVLTQYGTDDIALDLLFNAVGAVLVGLWGTGYFDGLARVFTNRFDDSSDVV
ncbi:hypothetical protein [Natronosalvus caseinilyticus]|uniref:hypothetical protein n=1 Tax=Natronosalvus caseinilyticus TaxID=2953747 RepID=UPI0028B01AA6|nr:hypothetical protein [Natronosalvus caseinilyticus]